jgi:hypothetical protein
MIIFDEVEDDDLCPDADALFERYAPDGPPEKSGDGLPACMGSSTQAR